MWAQTRGSLGLVLGELLVWLMSWDLYLRNHEGSLGLQGVRGMGGEEAAVAKEGFSEEVA